MPADTYTVPFGASARVLVKPATRKINWEGINVNQDAIAAEFNDQYSYLQGLDARLEAVEIPVFASAVGPFMAPTTFPIIGTSTGTPFQIEKDLISKMMIWNTPASNDYFLETVEEVSSPGKAITLTVSSWDGFSAVNVASVTVTKTETDAGTRDFKIDQVGASMIYGGLLVGDDFVTALAAISGARTTNFAFSQTQINYYSYQTTEVAPSTVPTGAHVHRTFVLPVGSQDGMNLAFGSVGAETWVTDSLMVYLNGVPYAPAEIVSVTGTSFSLSGSVPANRIPNTAIGSELRVSYVVNL